MQLDGGLRLAPLPLLAEALHDTLRLQCPDPSPSGVGSGAAARDGGNAAATAPGALSVEIVERLDREGPFARREKAPMGRPAQGKRGQPINRAGAQLMPTCLVAG